VPPATAYAVRTWYTSILGQTQAVRQDLLAQLDAAKAEVDRLSKQVDHSESSIKALEHVLDTVDDWIRRLTGGDESSTKAAARPMARSGASTRRGARGKEGTGEVSPEAESREKS
jgi:uncharacterized damage-inducible protein DinB